MRPEYLITADIARDPDRLAKALQINFDQIGARLEPKPEIEEAGYDEDPLFEHEDDDGDPDWDANPRFHTFYKENNKHNSFWSCQVRCDEAPDDQKVTKYKFRLWRWDVNEPVPDPIPNSMPTPGTGVVGYVKKYPVGHEKAGEYIPPRTRTVMAKDDDNNTFVKDEFTHLIRKARYAFDVRVITKHDRRGPWSDTSAVGTASDNRKPPDPISVFIDVDQHRINLDPTQPTDPDDSADTHPDIAYTQYKVTTDSGGNNIVVLPSGRKLKDDYANPNKKWFQIKKPGNQTYYGWARNSDGSGNKSNWVSSPAGQKGLPPTPVAAPSVTFTKGNKPGNLQMDVSFTYGGTFNDDNIDAFIIKAIVDGKARWNRVEVEEGNEAGTFNATFKGVDVGDYCEVSYRPKARKVKGGFSPATGITAYETVSVVTPAAPTVTKKKHALRAVWTNPIARASIRHWEIEWYDFTGNLVEYDYFVVKMRDSIPRKKVDGVARCRVRYITVNDTASNWSDYSGTDSAEGTKAEDLDTTSSKLDTSFFYNGAIGDASGWTGLNNLGDITAGTITGALIRTNYEGNARIVLGASGEADRMNVHGWGGTRYGSVYADNGNFVLQSLNGADLKLAPGGRVHFSVDNVPGSSPGALNAYLNVRVNGANYKIRLHED